MDSSSLSRTLRVPAGHLSWVTLVLSPVCFPGSHSPLLPRQGWDLLPRAAQDGEVGPKKPLLSGSLIGAASPRTADGSSHRHSWLAAFLSFLS